MTRLRVLLVAALAPLALAGAALAAYPGTYGMQGSGALVSRDGSIRYLAANSGGNTQLDALRASGGILRSRTIEGSFGIPTLITTSTPLGLFHDGRTFVLQSTANQRTTSFALVRASDLRVRERITLRGSYAFDAVAPDGRTLYLIQHRSQDLQHYVVRAYDLRAHRLRPGRIADKTQASWVMQGWPASRVETRTGRWVYTLYSNPGGFPFVHALDTVKGVAHCVGIAWKGSQNFLDGYRLKVDGGRLLVLRPDGTTYRSIDRQTWAVALR
jgi:hypothetical protein